MSKADNLPPSCAVVTKSGNLNFLEPSGPLQAYNGTALHPNASVSLFKQMYTLFLAFINTVWTGERPFTRPLVTECNTRT